jgi:hypothetical protein
MDEMFTSRTLNLPSGKPLVTLLMLIAQRTSKFELTHKLGLAVLSGPTLEIQQKTNETRPGDTEEVKSLA